MNCQSICSLILLHASQWPFKPVPQWWPISDCKYHRVPLGEPYLYTKTARPLGFVTDPSRLWHFHGSTPRAKLRPLSRLLHTQDYGQVGWGMRTGYSHHIHNGIGKDSSPARAPLTSQPPRFLINPAPGF